MVRPVFRVPEIKSIIAIALAYLDWPPAQVVQYSQLLGLAVTENFLEDCLQEPWPQFKRKADPVQVAHLEAVLQGLGIQLRADVFGIVPQPFSEMLTPADPEQAIEIIMALLANYPKAHIRLAIHPGPAGRSRPRVTALVNTGNRFLLCDKEELDGIRLVNELYANCVARLSITGRPVDYLRSNSIQETIGKYIRHEFTMATQLSKTRVMQLLDDGNNA